MDTVIVQADYTVYSGESFDFTDAEAFGIQQVQGHAAPSLTIAGAVTETWTTATGYSRAAIGASGISDSSQILVDTTGALKISALQGGANVYDGGLGSDPDFVNRGLVQLTSLTIASAGGVHGGDMSFENSGVFRIDGGGMVRGIDISNQATVINSGLIDITAGLYEHGFGIGPYAVSMYAGTFLNSGTIQISDPAAGSETVAVSWYDATDPFSWQPQHSWLNTGTIQGDVALQVSQPASTQTPELFTNQGRMIGRIDLGPGGDHLLNSGRIDGEVDLGAGADTYAGATGVSGAVHGGAGDDVIIAGLGTNYLRGDDGNDSIVGGSGFNDINGNLGDDTIEGHSQIGDWLVGGQGNDLIESHTSGNILYGNIGNDTLVGGAGDEIIRGGQGDDSITAGAGRAWISGDRGDDTIQGGSGADTFHTFADAGIDRVLGFSEAKGDHVEVDPGTVYAVSQVGADTVINMTGGGQMVLVGVDMANLHPGWIFGA
ncbi:calcium-binding protein [Phenylobacterium sp.]|uniref:calcium-binding protein n=1 Tax=Phenylobacterium sp. TaxID=1871053 RepID=UPI002DF4ABC6|nr:calcium-binding protein [Phenylobacterium sp.]